MAAESYESGLLDTNILILRKWIDPAELPAVVAISAITLAELSADPHEVRPGSEQKDYEEHAERARRLDICNGPKTSSTRFRSASRRLVPTVRSRPQSSPQGASHGAAPWT